MKRKILPLLFIVCLLIFDQLLKFYVKTTMTIGESHEIFPWFKILFVENPGMAFGLTLGSKYVLTIFRIVFAIFIFYYMWRMVKRGFSQRYIYIVALILAGAVGNIFDCLFYGLIFSESTSFQVAVLLPDGGGYAPFLMGKVVDMFYFPLFTFPEWMPFVGGDVFFGPIFNLADSYITIGVFAIILFFRHSFNESWNVCFPPKKTDL